MYELISVYREDGLNADDTRRIGRRYSIVEIREGSPAILVHANDPSKATFTSAVREILRDEEGEIAFKTRNTNYIIRKVAE